MQMLIGALGDIHGAFETVEDIMTRHPDVPLWVSVGDVASNDGEYSRRSRRCTGSRATTRTSTSLRRRWPGGRRAGTALPAQRRSVAGGALARRGARRHVRAELVSHAGGGAAAVARAENGGTSLKLGKSRDDKRRHFVRDEVVACKALAGIDVFLTHEAPRPFYPAGRRIDAGKTVLNEVLTAMRPRLHLFGHHHEFTDSIRQGVRSIGLDVVTTSYLLVDAATLRCERVDT